jgi:hypothetical protein
MSIELNKATSSSVAEQFSAFGVVEITEAVSASAAEQFGAEVALGTIGKGVSATKADRLGAGIVPQKNTGVPWLIAVGQPLIAGGVALTVVGNTVGQAVYWELVSYDPETGAEGPALGQLMYNKTVTDGAMHSKNYYFSPHDPALAGKTDRVKATVAHA